MWAQFAELGLLGASFSEDEGGFGGGPIEAMIISEEFGKGLVIEPYLQTVIIGGNFLRHGGSAAQKEEHIAGLIGGEKHLRLRLFGAEVALRPQRRLYHREERWRWLHAERPQGRRHRCALRHSPLRHRPHLWRPARQVRHHRLPRAENAKGVTTRDYPTVDGLRASEVYFENVAVGADAVVGEVDNGLPLVEKVVDYAIAALCAEACGGFKVLNEATIAYAKQRKQFGQPIANFQVLQHRMVDMFMAAEQAISMTYMVTLKLDEADKARKLAASGAKVQIGKAGRLISQDAVQIHGGMGMTDELNVGHFFKRVTMIESQFGNTDWHLRRYTELSAT